MADCAAFCSLSADLLARQSAFMVLSCQACGEACRRCARECESVANDPPMKACMAACEKCEETCRNMVRMMGAELVDPPGRPAATSLSSRAASWSHHRAPCVDRHFASTPLPGRPRSGVRVGIRPLKSSGWQSPARRRP